MNTEPSRSEFAAVAADAYLSQYGNRERRSRVMNNPVIDYDAESNRFSWTSSLVPTGETEIRVSEIENGMFGDVDTYAPDIESDIANYIANYADDYWHEVLNAINEGLSYL